MSRTYYPSDEYDSFELDQERAKRRRRWLKTWRRDDDDDDPPPVPVPTDRPKAPRTGAVQAV